MPANQDGENVKRKDIPHLAQQPNKTHTTIHIGAPLQNKNRISQIFLTTYRIIRRFRVTIRVAFPT